MCEKIGFFLYDHKNLTQVKKISFSVRGLKSMESGIMLL